LKGGTTCIYNPPIPTEILNADVISVNIFPNPASDKLNIQLNATNAVQLSIYNQLGQRVAYYEINSGLSEINTEKLSNGSYFLNFRTDNMAKTEKLLIIK
jgi:hypothetical protein